MRTPPKDKFVQRPFKYVPSELTNVAATIQRARKAIEEAERPVTNVRPLARKEKKAA